MEIKYPRRYTL